MAINQDNKVIPLRLDGGPEEMKLIKLRFNADASKYQITAFYYRVLEAQARAMRIFCILREQKF